MEDDLGTYCGAAQVHTHDHVVLTSSSSPGRLQPIGNAGRMRIRRTMASEIFHRCEARDWRQGGGMHPWGRVKGKEGEGQRWSVCFLFPRCVEYLDMVEASWHEEKVRKKMLEIWPNDLQAAKCLGKSPGRCIRGRWGSIHQVGGITK